MTIVKVDTDSEATVELLAKALAVANGTEWDLFPAEDAEGDVYRRDARAILETLDQHRHSQPTSRADEQVQLVWKMCNGATRKAMREALPATEAKSEAFMAATLNVAELMEALNELDSQEQGK